MILKNILDFGKFTQFDLMSIQNPDLQTRYFLGDESQLKVDSIQVWSKIYLGSSLKDFFDFKIGDAFRIQFVVNPDDYLYALVYKDIDIISIQMERLPTNTYQIFKICKNIFINDCLPKHKIDAYTQESFLHSIYLNLLENRFNLLINSEANRILLKPQVERWLDIYLSSDSPVELDKPSNYNWIQQL